MYDRTKEDVWLYNKSKNNEGFKNLIDLIKKESNIMLAVHNIKNNKGSKTKGVDGRDINDILNMEKEELLIEIRNQLDNYKPKPVRRQYIPKANGKLRPLGIPTILDRIVQQCVLQVLKPIGEGKFLKVSHGFRKGKGTQTALSQVYRMIQRQKLYYAVNVDIKDFFNEVNHRRLRQILWNNGIKDKKLLKIIDLMLKSGYSENGIIYKTPKGLMQGGILSPLLSNFYLNELDKWIESQWKNFPTNKNYITSSNNVGEPVRTVKYRQQRKTKLKEMYIVRYADDFIIFNSKYNEAIKTKHAVSKWLKENLKLEINKDKTKVIDLKKKRIEFLGFSIGTQRKHNKYKVKSNVSDHNIKKIKKHSKTLIKKIKDESGEKNKLYKNVIKYNAVVMGWHNYYQFATHVSKDFGHIRQSNYWMIETRLKNMLTKKSKGLLSGLTKNYSKTQIKYVSGIALLPIGNISTKTPRDVRMNYYDNPETIKSEIPLIQRITVYIGDRGLEYSENRLQKFILQDGKCGITGKELFREDIHCHHIKPLNQNGTNKLNNLIIIHSNIHKLVHSNKMDFIEKEIERLELTNKQINKINKLRQEIGLNLI